MNRIIHGDCREVLRTLERGSISACVTDPPYHLTSIVKRFGGENAAPAQHGTDGAYARASAGFMGKQWDGGDIAFRPETWRLVFDAMKHGAYLVAFASARGYHRMVCAIEDAGFVIHPMLGWISGQGFPKAMNLSKQIDKHYGAEREVVGPPPYTRGATEMRYSETRKVSYDCQPQPVTAPATPEARQWEGWAYGLQSLKPALEPICLAQKPAIRAGMVANVLQHGTGALNIDASRVEADWANDPNKRGLGYGWTRKDDKTPSVFRSDTVAAYDTTKGRWPANVLHDGSEEVEAAFAAFGEGGGGDGKDWSAHKAHGTGNGSTFFKVKSTGQHFSDSGTASRFFYSAKADKADRADSRHPTVKPVDLMRWLVRLVTPPGGTILDPFAGSGTTGEAAMLEGFDCIMIERDPQSVADIRHRIKRWSGEDTPLFAGVAVE